MQSECTNQMNRRSFISKIGVLPALMTLSELNSFAEGLPHSNIMPALFLGHGSPMNAIEENEFVKGFRTIAKTFQKPKAIVCVSAHWETKGTKVTAMQKPRTIHDFGGFPRALFEQQYPAPGSPSLAEDIKSTLSNAHIELDHTWGLDHGAWTVLKHLYPEADIPVIQLSLDYGKTPKEHYALAQNMQQWRRKGILIVGSGNLVHNLGMIAWDRMHEDNYAYDWALEASSKMKELIIARDIDALANYGNLGTAFRLAIPTPDHYLPMLYALALQQDNEELAFFNDKAVAGSLTMTSFKIG